MASAVEQLTSSFNFSIFSKAEDLKKRVCFTLIALIIYRFGTYIPLPGINPKVIQEFTQSHSGGILGILDMFSGGAMGRMTIFALNIMPYISSSIIIQLLTSLSPYLESLKKEGESGKKKINQYIRYGTVILAVIQGLGVAVGLEKITISGGTEAVINSGFIFKLSTILTLTGGTLFIMWLGEQITSRGIGNGISLIIYSGIVANLPQSVVKTFILGREGEVSTLLILAILLMIVLIISYIVFMEKAQRRIPIQYPKKQMSVDRPPVSQSSHLPLKLNSSGVIPPIFASSLLLFPATISSFSGVNSDSWFGFISLHLSHGKPLYITLYILLILFFSFFYTSIVFNPLETAENLRKSGGFIPGVRPGKTTSDFLDYILTRLTMVGALYLASICILPELILAKVSLPFYLGGTSLLIVVNVTIDTINQLQSHLVAYQYEGLIRKAKIKGKL